jgi:HEAT repeat protein
VLKALAKRGLPKAVEPLLQALEGLEAELTVPPAAKSALKALRGSGE